MADFRSRVDSTACCLAYAFYGMFTVSLETGYWLVAQSPPEIHMHGWILLRATIVLTLGSWVWTMRKPATAES